jgi:signal transduction histidine kinase
MQYGLTTTLTLFLGAVSLALISTVFGLRRALKKREEEVRKEKQESTRRLYELAILKEIGDRAGYSLDVEEVLRIITGSLHQFIEFSTVSYIVVKEDKFKLNTYLESSVDKTFLVEMKGKMLASLGVLLDKTIDPASIEESMSGAIYIEDVPQKVGSFFNIPLVISGKLAGLLTISHTKEGLYQEKDMTILYKITAQASDAVTRLEEVVHKEEEKISKVREQYTSMIVHELRSPLDGMKKIVELIVSGSVDKDSPQFKEYISLLQQSSSATLELVNDILDYSKLQAGKFEIDVSPSNIREVINNRISFYSASALSRNIKLDSVPAGDIPEKILFDERSIRQVLNNFISNALKFTSSDGEVHIVSFIFDPKESFSPEIKSKMEVVKSKVIESDIKVKDKSLVVLVSDNGVGIEEDKKKDLFLTYKQINASEFKEIRGTGLGLVIAKGIVEGHGGVVGAVSTEHVGSTFFFAIPLKS